MKRRKPKFERQDADYRKKLRGKGWRRPTGYKSGQRLGKRGKKPVPKIGYGSSNSLKEFVINSLTDLKVVSEGVVIRLSGSLGKRKKYLIAKELLKKGIVVKGFNAEGFVKKVESELAMVKKKVKKGGKVKEEKASVK